jgi:filamentous hemagglutinin family protein
MTAAFRSPRTTWHAPWSQRARLVATSALAGSLSLAVVSHAYAIPGGGVVVGGQAVISVTAPGALVHNQTTANAAINWRTFGIGQGESVQFVQPDAHSVALNRVLGSDPSVILGRLSANGQVFLVNPNGVLFGSTAQVNVGGLVASTLQIRDADFMAGRYSFTDAGPGAVANRGSIIADGGSVACWAARSATPASSRPGWARWRSPPARP